MENERLDEIIYEGDWQTFETPVSKESHEECESIEAPDKPKKMRHFISLITIQLIISLLIAFVIFMLKAMDGNVYKSLRLWYKENTRKTLFSNEVFEDIDLTQYFNSTPDSMPATYDEV